MRQVSRLSSLLVVTLVAAACQDAADQVSPAPQTSARVGGGQSGAQAPDLETLDRAVPGFGGFFLDASGTPTIYLTDARGRGAAEQALSGYLRARGLDVAALRVVPAQFSYRQLQRWFELSSVEVFAVPGMVYADMQEATNRLEFGVENLAAGSGVLAITRRLGIPDGAVAVVETEPIIPVVTLQDKVRPVAGGLQIHFFPVFVCTLGFNARDGTEDSFIIPSYCTRKPGGVEDTPYWQPAQSVEPVQIGTEVEDPEYQRNITGCPRGRRCRHSDAARAAYAGGLSFALGVIKMTNLGSIEITGDFNITAEDLRTNFTMGETLSKVGGTTGRTQGSVTNTCATVGSQGGVVLICQTFVDADVAGGDGGAPVFRLTGGNNVALAGMVWGGDVSGSEFIFSPLANIETELGALATQ